MTAWTALPGRTVDLIRDGVRPAQLRAEGGRAVRRALVSTAASAIHHGHDFADWATLISEARSTLGRQARLRDGKRERTQRDYGRTLLSAWTAAEKFLATAPAPYSRDEITARIAAVRDWTANADSPLDDSERAVMAAACEVAARNGTDRPALPRRELVATTGLGERTVRTTLDRLHRRGLLVLEVPGRASTDAGRRRAALYRLPRPETLGTPYLYRETRSMGPPRQVYGTPMSDTPGTPPQIYGTPRATPADNPAPSTEEPPVAVTLTITAPDPAALAAALDAVRREQAVAVDVQPQPPQLAVLPGGRTDAALRRRRPAKDPAEPVPVPGQLPLPNTPADAR